MTSAVTKSNCIYQLTEVAVFFFYLRTRFGKQFALISLVGPLCCSRGHDKGSFMRDEREGVQPEGPGGRPGQSALFYPVLSFLALLFVVGTIPWLPEDSALSIKIALLVAEVLLFAASIGV